MDTPDNNQEGFIDESNADRRNADLKTVESQRNDLTAEEFPEGPYGTSLPVESLGKSTPWREDQRSNNRFSYENREFHAGISRGYPGAHPTHDSSGDDFSEESE